MILSKTYLMVLDTRVEVERPGIMSEELLCRKLNALVGQDSAPVDCLARYWVREDTLLIEVAIFISLLLLRLLRLQLKVLLYRRTLKSLPALNQNWVSH